MHDIVATRVKALINEDISQEMASHATGVWIQLSDINCMLHWKKKLFSWVSVSDSIVWKIVTLIGQSFKALESSTLDKFRIKCINDR